MITELQKFKYQKIAPTLVRLVKLIFGDRNSSIPSETKFVFIMGSGRNGSTLLSAILNQHKDIFIPPEQYIMPFAALKWQFNRIRDRKMLVDEFSNAFVKGEQTVNWQLDQESVDRFKTETAFGSFRSVMEMIFQAYADQSNKAGARWLGEQSPLMTHYLDILRPEFPHAKYIFLFRDPRSVIYSYSQVHGHPANDIDHAIWKWKDSALQYEKMKKGNDHTLMVKYEDLVSEPDHTVNTVLNFLELESQEGLLNYGQGAIHLGVSKLSHHQNLNKPINTKSIDKWKGNLSKESLEIIKTGLSVIAGAYGYDLD